MSLNNLQMNELNPLSQENLSLFSEYAAIIVSFVYMKFLIRYN